ncbi:hypothetical protein N305_12452, partial [Manacus vitellinus]
PAVRRKKGLNSLQKYFSRIFFSSSGAFVFCLELEKNPPGLDCFSVLSASVSHLLPHPEIKLGSLGAPGTVQTCQTCLHPFFYSRFFLPSFSLKFIGVSADSGGRAFPPHLWAQSNEESGVSALLQIWAWIKTRSWIPLRRSFLHLCSYSPATLSSNRLCCM